MVKIIPKLEPPTQVALHPKILYFGQNADEICDLVSPHIGMMAIDYMEHVGDALALVRSQKLDIIVVDQRGDNPSNQLILPLLRSIDYNFKLVVISALSQVGTYLRMPGVGGVLTAPLRARQLSNALGLDSQKIRHDKIKLAEEAEKHVEIAKPVARRSPLVFLSNIGMQLVSTAYKRLAFVLLGILFLSFTFYGTMIGFFLTSSTWAAPQTLTRGHVLVDRVEKDIGDLKVALNLNEQRLVEVTQKADEAKNAAAGSEILVNFAEDTVSKEIVSRQRQIKTIASSIARTDKIRKVFAKQLNSSGLSKDLANLFGKHLIDRKAYTSNTLSLLETGQRLAGIESELEILEGDRALLATQLRMLHSLKAQLQQTGPMEDITAASADLLLLTKQALDARAALETARSDFEVSQKTRQTLLNTEKLINAQISNMETSTLGRAIATRVDVLFVPYGNEARFKTGTALYSCSFTFIICSKVGSVGQILPGEIASVHPFFGKPIRGFFVEANLTDTTAATREIIHAGHPPLYL